MHTIEPQHESMYTCKWDLVSLILRFVQTYNALYIKACLSLQMLFFTGEDYYFSDEAGE